MLNISSIKEPLHNPAEIQWNKARTLPGKLKRKISGAFSYKVTPPEIIKMWEIAVLGEFLGSRNQCEISCFLCFHEFLKVSASIFWVRTVLTSN